MPNDIVVFSVIFPQPITTSYHYKTKVLKVMGYLNLRQIQSNEKQTQYLTNFEIIVIQRYSSEVVKSCIAVWCSGIAVKW